MNSFLGAIVLSGLTVLIYRQYLRGKTDYAARIPRLQYFIGGSETEGEIERRAGIVIEHKTEVS